jgi:hypothetical protein
MGYGSTTSYDVGARTAYRARSGTSYAYSSTMHAAPHSARSAHEMLDPKRINANGEKIRECLDSDEHPNTLPVVVLFDETGSMGDVPRQLQEKLATLKGVTLRAGLVDAQLCFGAYGDGQIGEAAPVQVGQFESGLEMEEWLNNIFLEGAGGGNSGESACLALYFLANHSRLDSLEKRGKKGYIFLTGDEVQLPLITKAEIKQYLDDDVEADLTPEQVVAMARESYEVFFLLVNNSTAHWQKSEAFWTKLLGSDHVIVVQDLDHISELISMILVSAEGVVDDVDDAVAMLAAEGGDPDLIARAVKDLVPYQATRGSVAKAAESHGTLTAADDATEGERL